MTERSGKDGSKQVRSYKERKGIELLTYQNTYTAVPQNRHRHPVISRMPVFFIFLCCHTISDLYDIFHQYGKYPFA